LALTQEAQQPKKRWLRTFVHCGALALMQAAFDLHRQDVAGPAVFEGLANIPVTK
jgi:hypothetical protein